VVLIRRLRQNGRAEPLRRGTALPVFLAVLFLAACGGGSDSSNSEEAEGQAGGEGQPTRNPPAPSGEAVRSAKVEIADFEYQPSPVTVQAGGKVTWLNEDADDHTATLDDGSFTTGTLAEGKLKSESFKVPGVYAYHCEIHPQMKGALEVVEPS
jgi:plastocyanin